MPLSNSSGMNLSIGRDVSVVLTVNGATIDLGNVTGFEANAVYSKVNVKRLDGKTLHAEIPDGWTGSFTMERANNNADAFFAQTEALWYSAGTLQNGTVTMAVTEADGSTSRYQFTGCALTFGKQTFKADAPVTMDVAFTATFRVAL